MTEPYDQGHEDPTGDAGLALDGGSPADATADVPTGEATAGTALPHGPGLASTVALPGVSLWRRMPVSASLLFAAGVIAPFTALLIVLDHRSDLIGLFGRTAVLRGVALTAVTAVISRLIAVWLASDYVPAPADRRHMRVWGSTVVTILALPTAFAVVRMEQVSSLVHDVFGKSVDQGRVVAAPGVDPIASQFHTVLMMGSDEGPDRLGLRTDSMILAFVVSATGKTALVSVPRNLTRLRFPPGSLLAEKYPKGFSDLVNALYITVDNDPILKSAYSNGVDPPGIRALMEGLSYSMGITIDDYVMVNSCAFVQVVDAIGGVDIPVDKKLPMPDKLKCSKYRLTPTIGPGRLHMDGTMALGFVRSRKADSDYYRMERQRQLLQAIVSQVGVADLLAHFGDLYDAVKANVRTSMTFTEARALLARLRGDGTFQSIGLVPPLLEPGHPDYPALRAYLQTVRQALSQGLPAPTVLPSSTTG
jgi:LCP family protein required for cell wall assembly